MIGGRICRKWLNAHQAAPTATEALICPLGDRPIPDGQQDAHHLVPKSREGRQTQSFHRICHRQIHALLAEAKLARRYPGVDALLSHPEVARLVAWVKSQPDDFYERTRKSQRLRPR